MRMACLLRSVTAGCGWEDKGVGAGGVARAGDARAGVREQATRGRQPRSSAARPGRGSLRATALSIRRWPDSHLQDHRDGLIGVRVTVSGKDPTVVGGVVGEVGLVHDGSVLEPPVG